MWNSSLSSPSVWRLGELNWTWETALSCSLSKPGCTQTRVTTKDQTSLTSASRRTTHSDYSKHNVQGEERGRGTKMTFLFIINYQGWIIASRKWSHLCEKQKWNNAYKKLCLLLGCSLASGSTSAHLLISSFLAPELIPLFLERN